MKKTQISLALLASVTMGSALPLDMRPVTRGIKTKCTHLVRCVQGKEPCNKTDFVILATGLVFARSSFHAILAMGKKTYQLEPENHGDKVISDKRKNRIGLVSRKTSRILHWGPGELPETVVRKVRKWWAAKERHNFT